MNEDFLKSLSDDQKDRLKNCKTPEDMLAFAKKAGYELSDDALDAVSGGYGSDNDDCPKVCYELTCSKNYGLSA